ncbi:hypothetical protein AAFF_G00061800 [Aldrovandia affinis]|uniref:Uncharacterized protein n=1 Tax=Aldrovandia affinis TaxID=143900 RepID=A0AAD7RZL9_9TELE|nr:hypothetical protein AAFF_G00061800 [Aldrovandia affinis]
MYMFKAYPKSEEYNSVAKTLTDKHPCLKEPGSSGWHGWKFRLKFKMGNFRQKLHIAGCSELTINSQKRDRFRRIVSTDLVKTFFDGLDKYMPGFADWYRVRDPKKGELKTIIQSLDENK